MSDPVLGAVDRETAYAKINLALHVRKRMPDGYHQIETIFAFLDKGDLLSVETANDSSLVMGGPFAEGLSSSDNLVIRAAHRLAEMSDVRQGARIRLDKRLPVASGIGGGSADAAATLRLLNRFWKLNFSMAELATIARPLGADVPACVESRSCRGTGIGQDLIPICDDQLQQCAALLINPLVAVSTANIFASWDGVDRGALKTGQPITVAREGRNDLQLPAVALVPQLTDVLQLLDECQPIMARMSGSGATCFALFDNLAAAEEAGRYCRQTMENIWTMAGDLR